MSASVSSDILFLMVSTNVTSDTFVMMFTTGNRDILFYDVY